MKTGKKLLSLLLAFLLAVGTIPASAFAEGAGNNAAEDYSVDVSLAITSGEDSYYYADQSNTVMIQQDITVPYFDLALYGLEEYYYNPDCYDGSNSSGSQTAGTAETAKGIVTAMHAFIWATEVFYCGYSPEEAGQGKLYESGNMDKYISWTGNAGSSFMDFWDHGTNLNYYINYAYPLGAAGWGSTSDQQTLSDGDIISMHLIQDSSVYGSNFQFFSVNDTDGSFDGTEKVDKATITQGDEFTLTLYETQPDWVNYLTTYEPMVDSTLYWCSENNLKADITDWQTQGFAGISADEMVTDENGQFTFDTTKLEPGTYYIAAPGYVDSSSGTENGSAVFELTVEAAPVTEFPVTVTVGDDTVEVIDTGVTHNDAPVYRVAVPATASITLSDTFGSTAYRVCNTYSSGINQPFVIDSRYFSSESYLLNDAKFISYFGENTGVNLKNPVVHLRIGNSNNQLYDSGTPNYTLLVEMTGTTLVDSITLDQTELELKVNESGKLTSTISPEDAFDTYVIWTSSDTSVATVSDGTVKGINPGTATITATSSNGLTAVCDVTVVESDVLCNITIPEGEGYKVTGDSTVLTGHDYTFTLGLEEGYTASNDFAVKVNGKAVTAGEDGSYTVEYVTSDLTITVTGVVCEGYFEYAVTDVPSNGNSMWGYISKINISGDQGGVDSYLWEDSRTLVVLLNENTPDDGVINCTFVGAGTKKPSISGHGDVTLVDGEATINVSVKATFSSYNSSWTVKFAKDVLPVLAEDQESIASAEITANENYTLDLTSLFTDADGDELIYQVKVDDGEYTSIDGTSYTYSNKVATDYTLTFRAFDGFAYSEDTYTVNLTVTNSAVTYDVIVNVSDIASEVVFYCTIGFDSNGYDIIGDQLAAESNEESVYTVKVPENVNQISIECDGARMAVNVSQENSSVTVQQTAFIAKTVSGEEDNDAVITVSYGDGCKAIGSGHTFYLVSGEGYTYTATPSSNYSSSWTTATLENQTVTTDASATVTMELKVKNAKSITVDEGAELHVYYQSRYYVIHEVDPAITAKNEDGTVTYTYSCSKSSSYSMGYMYFATKKDCIDKAGYLNSVTDTTITWEDDDRTSDYRADYDASTTYGSRGDDSILVNVNKQNHLVLNEGETFRLRSFRIWEIIDSDTTNVMIEPEFTYDYDEDILSMVSANTSLTNQVCGISGNNWMDITATGSGVAFLEVGYEAIHIVDGYSAGSWGGAYGQEGNFTYNAIDPDRTALIVVQTDGKAATDVDFGIKCYSSNVGGNYYEEASAVDWDAEFDTRYFTGDSGSLEFAPSAVSGTITEIAVSSDKGENWTVLEDNEGVYTAKIFAGNNIIRVTKDDGTTAYQVVRGDKITYEISITKDADEDGNADPGDTVRVTFDGMHNPVGKMSGIYNPGYGQGQRVTYTFNGEETRQSGYYQYNFVTNAWIEVTIPEDADSENYTLSDGYINFNVFGNAPGSHRTLTDTGASVNTSAASSKYTRCILPEVTLDVELPEPEITAQPEDFEGKVGETAVFTAEASGAGLSYQWQYQNVGTTTWKNSGQEGSQSNTLNVPITAARDGQKYRCVVTDVRGVQVISEEVHIKAAAAITAQPEDYTGSTGEKAVFTVKATGVGLSYQWQYQNVGTTTWKNSSQSGNQTNTLNVPITAARDGQKYRCIVTDKHGDMVISDVVMIILKNIDIAITTQPKDYEGQGGDTAVFAVRAEGNGLTYQWQYCNAGCKTWRNSSQDGNQSNTLNALITESRNGQKYRCVITDENGDSVISDAAMIVVVTAE